MRCLMNLILWATALVSPSLPSVHADDRLDRVTFYEVPLTCPAAKGLGCGSAAKPILLDLERTSLIDEAWLDQRGTTMAIVWTRGSAANDRKIALSAVTEARGLDIEEITGDGRKAAAAGFAAGKGWHRGADVDKLSEREAHVIGDRVLARLTAKAPSSKANIAALRSDLVETIRQLLVGTCTSLEQCREKLVAVARRHLNAAEVTSFAEAMEAEYRAIDSARKDED